MTTGGLPVLLVLLGICATLIGGVAPVAALQTAKAEATGRPRRNLTARVDTRIGTAGNGWGIGMSAPQVQVPFGCMRVGPDTSLGLEPFRLAYDDFNGYFYANGFIECFSHTHLVGAGIGDLQNIGVMPTRWLNASTIQNSGYRSRFSHATETAMPGYYAVALDDAEVTAEMAAAGTHTGIHRYTFHGGAPAHLIIDICHAAAIGQVSFEIGAACKQAQVVSIQTDPDGSGALLVAARVLTAGSFSGRSRIGGIWIYFKARVSVSRGDSTGDSPLKPSMWMADELLAAPNFTTTTSKSLGVVLTVSPHLETDNLVILVHAAISFISLANADVNMDLQLRSKATGAYLDFDAAVQSTVDEWEAILQRVQVREPPLPAGRASVFYSSVYRAHQVPTTYSEANGRFLGMDYVVGSVEPGRRYLSDLSIWDTYRTHAPLLAITAPEIARDLADSMMRMYRATGELPKWVLANVETDCMVGLHSAVIFADMIMNQVGGLPPVSEIFTAVVDRVGAQNEKLKPLGFVPFEVDQRGSSLTLDYALDAGAVYNLAKYLKNATAVAAFEAPRATFRNVWDNGSVHVMPRFANGSFMELWPLTPYPLERHFTEGNAEQYRWYVPHDLRGLVGLFPNRTYMADELNRFFALSELWPFNTTLPNWAYWAGNEPDILAPFIFNFIDNEFAWLTQLWVPRLLDTNYFPFPAGIPGNDDYGCMSAWVIFAHLGLYPIAATGEYALFAPQFDLAEVTVPLGAASPWRHTQPNSANRTVALRVVAHGRPRAAEAAPVYLANATVNGAPLEAPIVTQEQLLAVRPGAHVELALFLSAEPSVFGRALPSQGGPSPFTPSQISEDESRELLARVQRLVKSAAGQQVLQRW